MPATISDYLQRVHGGSALVEINVGTWVQLVNNITSTAYVSTSATDANGKFTVASIPAGTYTVNTGPTNTGPWTATGDSAYVVGPDLRLFNVLDYGADPTGVASSTTAFASAVSAINTAGGGVLFLPPGTYSGVINVNVNVRVEVLAWGATLRPGANNTGLTITQSNGATAPGCEVYGLVIDGQSLASVIGVLIQDTDRASLRNCRVLNCTTGVSVLSATGGRWAEENALLDCFIYNCTTGVSFSVTSGTPSLGETHMSNVGISGCATGIALNTPITFYRCRLLGVTIWLPTSGLGLKIDGDVRDSVFVIDFENLNGSATGITGVQVTTNAVNVDLLDAHFGFTGTFATQVSDSTGKGLVWSNGTHRLTTAAGNGFWGAAKIVGDTNDRVRFATQFAGGGGVQFGVGGPVDVNLYRAGAALLATDGDYRVGGHLLSTGTAPTAAAGGNAGTSPPAPVVAASSTDQRGSLTFGTGTTPAAGAMAVVTFHTAFAAAPFVVLTWQNASGAGLGQAYATSVGTGGFTIDCTTAPAGSQANTTYSVGWQVVG